MDAVSKVAELELAEKEKMKDKVAKILKHGCSVFINRQLIYNYPEQLFADAGVMAIEHADFEGVERLALVTGECNFLSLHSACIPHTTPTPVDRMTHACENITFPYTSYMVGNEVLL